jgi:hypothetical protein
LNCVGKKCDFTKILKKGDEKLEIPRVEDKQAANHGG